jgi:hypothetical protein
MYRIGLIIIAAVLLLTAFVGCGQSATTPPESGLKTPENADGIAEGLLQAFNLVDYSIYLKSFDVTAGKAMSQDWFEQTANLVQSKVGYYVTMSKVATEVKPTETYTDVIYKTEFSNEPAGVYVTVAIYVSGDTTYAEGIWFNSPKLFGEE